MIRKTYKSFSDAMFGLKTVLKEETNFKIEIFFATVVLFFMFYFEFSLLESAILLLCVVLVLSSEIVNTAIEDLCNKIEPNENAVIGKIKDVMAAYVLLSVFGSILVGIFVFYHHFSWFLSGI